MPLDKLYRRTFAGMGLAVIGGTLAVSRFWPASRRLPAGKEREQEQKEVLLALSRELVAGPPLDPALARTFHGWLADHHRGYPPLLARYASRQGSWSAFLKQEQSRSPGREILADILALWYLGYPISIPGSDPLSVPAYTQALACRAIGATPAGVPSGCDWTVAPQEADLV